MALNLTGRSWIRIWSFCCSTSIGLHLNSTPFLSHESCGLSFDFYPAWRHVGATCSEGRRAWVRRTCKFGQRPPEKAMASYRNWPVWRRWKSSNSCSALAEGQGNSAQNAHCLLQQRPAYFDCSLFFPCRMQQAMVLQQSGGYVVCRDGWTLLWWERYGQTEAPLCSQFCKGIYSSRCTPGDATEKHSEGASTSTVVCLLVDVGNKRPGTRWNSMFLHDVQLFLRHVCDYQFRFYSFLLSSSLCELIFVPCFRSRLVVKLVQNSFTDVMN